MDFRKENKLIDFFYIITRTFQIWGPKGIQQYAAICFILYSFAFVVGRNESLFLLVMRAFASGWSVPLPPMQELL